MTEPASLVYVLGGGDGRSEGPVADLGRYRATDGSDGARVGVDLARPHAALVVGKRGSGKSNTLGVLAAALADAPGVVPLLVDPLGAFAGPGRALTPTVPADALAPPAWCDLLGLDAASGPGALVWRAASARETLSGMREFVADAAVPGATRRAADNHLRLAADWGVFDAAGLSAASLCAAPTVLDLSGLSAAPANGVVRTVAAALYDARLRGEGPLPWLLVDEAHVFFDGVAAPALERICTRGRVPGVSLVAATQRPGAVPEVAVSQADLLVAHRLTAAADREALARFHPAAAAAVGAGAAGSGADGEAADRPAAPGEALAFDDASDRAHAIRVRERDGRGGASPRAGDGAADRSGVDVTK